MSVIVKNMEMPKGSCEWIGENGSLRRCKLLNGDDDCKMQEGVCADATWEEQFAGCPLVEIPTPHGRLVDLDKMVDEYWDGSSMRIDKTDIKEIEEYDVLVEAEGRQHHD